MSNAMQASINEALDQAVVDRAVVVLSGRPGVFSAGFDLPVLTKGGSDAHDMLKGGFELALRLFSFPTPVVIACTGHALAMGCFLVMAADYRVGARGAYKIGANEVAIGMTLPFFAIEILRQRLSTAYFSRAALNAEIFAPDVAVSAGFLDAVVPPEELADAAQQRARQLSNLDFSAYAATKLRLREPVVAVLRRALEVDDTLYRERR